MPTSKIFLYVFAPAIVAAILGWFLPKMLFGEPVMGSQGSDAFIFACLPIIAYYISLYVKAKGQDKRGIGALLFIFAISVAFWTIYNQNSTGLTLWAEKHTNREVSPSTEKLAGSIGFLQTVNDQPRWVNKVDEHFVDLKDTSAILNYEKSESIITVNNKPDTLRKLLGITVNGNKVDSASKIIQVMGPDPYFNNVPKEEWPNGKDVKLMNTELFQSINPLFIVLLTLVFVPFFQYAEKKKQRTNHSIKIRNGIIYCWSFCTGHGFFSNVSSICLYS